MAEFNLTSRMTTLVEDTTDTMSAMTKKLMDASRGAFNTTRDEAEQLIERGEDLFDKLVERGQEVEFLQNTRVNTWLKMWDERESTPLHMAEEQLENTIQTILRALHIPTYDEIKRLDQELDRIAKKLDMQIMERDLASLPIADFKAKNVKQVLADLSTLDEEGLRQVQQFEQSHHNRKTILREIDQRLEALKA